MRRWSFVFEAAVAAVAIVASAAIVGGQLSPAAAQTQTPAAGRTFTAEELAAFRASLPEGPARETVIRVCGQCHEPNRAGSLRLTREGWEGVIEKMKGLGASALASEAELVLITDYLSENFKGEAPRPINMNSASAIDLEAVAGLLRKEAAIWIAYRSKTPCKSLDDLKKVDGLPFEKIDQRRDRLVCF
jgi:competence protein ComEA